MTQIIENVEGYYETHEVPFGRTYEWHQAHVILECDCGERLTLTGSVTICRCCGADHADVLREKGEIVGHRQLGDEVLHPWDHDTQAQVEQRLRGEALIPRTRPGATTTLRRALRMTNETISTDAVGQHSWQKQAEEPRHKPGRS